MISKTIKTFTFYLFSLLILTGCLGQKGEKKADCASGEQFNSVSRVCEGAQRPPVGLLDDAVIYEDSGANEILITYSDPNGTEAVSCQINYLRTFVWLRSPEWGSSQTEATNALIVGNNAATGISPVLNPVERTNALVAMNSATLASSEIPSSRTNIQRATALRQTAGFIRDAGNIALTVNDGIVQTRGQQAVETANALDNFATAIEYACSCNGGVCKTIAIPDKNWFGEVGFSYSINDGQANSPSEQVNLRVLAINDAPIPDSQNIAFFESITSAPTPVTFTVNFARDIEDDLFAGFFNYTIVADDPLKGTLTDCMDKVGSTGPTDRTCTYTPINGDVFGVGSQSVAFNFNGIDWLANAAGVHGDGITVTFIENPITRSGGINGVGGASTVEIDVVGDDITITIESDTEVVGPNTYNAHTVQNVVDAINSHPYARALLSVAINGGALGTDPVTTGFVALAGGVDGYDQITYRLNDGSDDSAIDGVISINITAVNDPPVAYTAPITLTEDVVQTITLAYTDAEVDSALFGAAGCTITAITSNIQLRNTCTCDAAVPSVCTVDVVGLIDHNIPLAPGSFQYTINNGQLSNTAQVDFTITPVDDLPLPVLQNAYDKVTGIDMLESDTALPGTYTFDLTPVVDVDSADTPVYEVLSTANANGAVTDCLNLPGSTGPTDLECTFIPTDGNINDNNTHLPASETINAVLYQALFDGNVSGGVAKNLSIEIEETVGVSPTAPLVYFEQSGTLAVPPTNMNIKILVAPAATPTTANDIVNTVNTHPYLQRILFASTIAGATPQVTTAAQLINDAPGGAGIGYFDYRVTVGAGVSEYGRVNINMTPNNDVPVICHYSSFEEAPECGLMGCTGSGTPIGSILPSKVDVYYYDTSRALCFRSTGTATNNDWEIVASYVADQFINEKDKIIIEGIRVDEGGGDTTENLQRLRVLAAPTSTNTTLVPVNQISLFYDDLPLTPGVDFGDGASEDTREFRIEIQPAALQVGTSTISFQIDDVEGGIPQGNAITVSFDVTVHPVSALHNGWENIRALGPKVSAVNTVLDMTEVCTYNRSNCNGGASCSGTSDPLNAVVPDKQNVVFYNTSTKACFYADGLTAADWKPLKGPSLPDEVYCNITPQEHLPACDQGALNYGSCIGVTPPETAGIIPTKENQFYWDKNLNQCWRSRDLTVNGFDIGDWEIYTSTTEVFLEWKPFTVSGTGVLSGYNVFRRLPNGQFDYKRPINKQVINVSSYSYKDNAENSWMAPIPKTVYFYEVRPVINGISTGTSEAYKEVRIFVPPNNMAFAHRWIMNQSMCTLMNSTGIDSSNNFRCPYIGLGDSTVADGYYDVGQDYIVERFEASCNFSRSPSCSTAYGDCVGDYDPAVGPPAGTPITANAGDIFYNRSTGQCYYTDDGVAWGNLAADDITAHDVPENPPLVHFTQQDAYSYCQEADQQVNNFLGYNAAIARSIPNRIQQVAYSQWDMKANTDSQVSILETGLSINSSPKCNSSSASGLAGNYSDTAVPDTNTMYSLPGTASSNIRSVVTGSTYTNQCVSRFGIQDVVGNVKEWVHERIDCDNGVAGIGLSQCVSTVGPDGTDYLNINSTAITAYTNFRLDGISGPCRDTNSDGNCDSFMDKWLIDEERYNAGRWFVPAGLPVHTNFPITDPYNAGPPSTGSASPYMYEIGPTSGITASQLHDDAMTINSHYLFATGNGEGAMATGGSYLNGQEAGSYSFEFMPWIGAPNGYLTIGDISFKAINALAPNITFSIVDGGAASLDCAFTDGGGAADDTVVITIDEGGGETAANIINRVNTDADCNTEIVARLSGVDQNQSSTLAPIDIIPTPVTNSRVDVGFRCVLPVNNGNYLE